MSYLIKRIVSIINFKAKWATGHCEHWFCVTVTLYSELWLMASMTCSYQLHTTLNEPMRGQGSRTVVSASRRTFYLGVGVFNNEYLLYHIANLYLNIICFTFDSYIIFMYINKGELWSVASVDCNACIFS